MINKHVIKTWCNTQSVVALSSGEAEYYGLVRGGAQALGMRSILRDLGIECKIRLKTDATVAKSVASRKGCGKIRHIEVNQLWLQEKVNLGEIEIEKGRGEINRADALTKPNDGTSLGKQLAWTNL